MERDRKVHDPVHVVVENESTNLSSCAGGLGGRFAVHIPGAAGRLAQVFLLDGHSNGKGCQGHPSIKNGAKG